METLTFEVDAITCEHRVATIDRVVIEEVPGVGEITGDHETQRVTVECGPPTTIDAIAATMAEWDYPSKVV